MLPTRVYGWMGQLQSLDHDDVHTPVIRRFGFHSGPLTSLIAACWAELS
jgi:hypothetical protein